ncbi:MAG: hypothetical protein QXL14_02185 [Candidatus Aenigmatarchaeota archaeon]
MIDSIYIPVFVMVLIIILLFGFFLITKVFTALPLPEDIKETSIENLKNSAFVFFLVIYFGIPAASIILALVSGGNNLLLIISLILLIVNVFISSLMKNIFVATFENLEEATQFISSNPIMSKLIEFYPIIMFVFGLLIIFAQFFV